MPSPANGPPLLVVVAAGGATFVERPNSRRVTANADHINGPAAVSSPVPPVDSHDNRFAPIPSTEPIVAAGFGVAVITGADAAVVAAGTATVTTGVEPGTETVSRADDSAVNDLAGVKACDATGEGSTAAGSSEADPEGVDPVGVLTEAFSG